MSDATAQPLDLDVLTAAPAGPYTVHRVIGACEIHATHLNRTLAMHVAPDVAALFAASPALRDALRDERAAHAKTKRDLATVQGAARTLAAGRAARDEYETRTLSSLAATTRAALLRDLDAAREEARQWNAEATAASALRAALAYAASPDALRCDECGALATRSARSAREHGCDAHAHPEWPDLEHAATLREVLR